MGSTGVEKTEEELRKEIEELQRQQWEVLPLTLSLSLSLSLSKVFFDFNYLISVNSDLSQITERLRDPRGLRRGGLASNGPRNFTANGAGTRQRGFVRPAGPVDPEDQSAPKRRLSSAVVKIEDGEETDKTKDVKQKEVATDNDETGTTVNESDDGKLLNQPQQQRGEFSRRDGTQRPIRKHFEVPAGEEHVPRVLPKDEDPSLVNRNRRMLGQLLGTLEKFRKEDIHLSATEAFMRRSNSLQRAEQRAREESEKLRQQEREQIAEKRRRDLTLRARVAAKAEEKKLELLFLRWSEHHKKLSNFLRTKTEPHIFYLPTKPLVEDETLVEQQKEQVYLEWKNARREELTEYQKQIGEQCLANVETELERWQNARNTRKGNNNLINLQETMDKELETRQLEYGPKTTRKIPGGAGDDEEDVEDINVGEDDIMEDVLEVDDNKRIDAS
ncbi:Pinin/SDK/MemA protein [Macleaya cordata]|uniref:Pinin/SDK/MemA protein n=1 Tax=Macleaya cordata TaxID=56857 RepID=A0A200PTN1_MACCD|nr:Pinin/SDK/MemA protein [Macleaya cordata]